MTYVHTLPQEPNFGRPFLGHHYYILNLSDPCPSVEKKSREQILYFYCMAMPQHKKPCPGIMKFTILVDSSFCHLYFIHVLSLSDLCLGVEKKILEEIMHFHNVTYMATS